MAAIFALTALTGAINIFFSSAELRAFSFAAAQEGNRSFQAIMVSMYVVAGLVLVFHSLDRFLDLVRNNLAVVAFAVFVAASPLWAELPQLGIRRSVALFGNTLLAFYLVCRFSPEDFLKLLGWAMVLTLAINFGAAVVLPLDYVFQEGKSAVRGVIGHKNSFGQVMVLGAMIFWCLRDVEGWRGFRAWFGFAICSVLAFASASASAWIIYTGLFAVTVPLLRYLRRGHLEVTLRLLWVAIGAATVIVLVSQFFRAGLELVGKDATLTNRTVVWQMSVDLGWQRPWFGSGYGSFWEGWAGRAWVQDWAALEHAHNGFVDIWLQLGFIGAALMIAPIIVLGMRAVGQLVKYKDSFSTFCGLVFAYVFSYSWVTKIIPDHRAVVWTVFVACILYAGVSLQAIRKKKILTARLNRMATSMARGAASRGGGAQS